MYGIDAMKLVQMILNYGTLVYTGHRSILRYFYSIWAIIFIVIYELDYLEVSEPKWVNPILNNIGVNSLRFGGLHLPVWFISIQSYLLNFGNSRYKYQNV